jgi:hypothetical protein
MKALINHEFVASLETFLFDWIPLATLVVFGYEVKA